MCNGGEFIKVTEEATGKKVIISGDFVVKSDNFSTVIFHHEEMIRVSESIEQIENQLLRDEFAMRVADGLIKISTYAGEQATNAYALADAMLIERNN